MLTGKTGKTTSRASNRRNQRRHAPLDPLTAEPNVLRDGVRDALSLLDEDKRSRVRDRLLADLRKAGVNLGQCLLLLGIPARTAEELTAAEIATLIRYVRISEPKALEVLVPVLSETLTPSEPAQNLRLRRKAA